MKSLTKLVHRIVLDFRLDGFVASAAYILPLLKLVPLPHEYPVGTMRLVSRNNVRFLLDISDYMQWYVFASISDLSWYYAAKCLEGLDSPVLIDVGASIGAFSLKIAAYRSRHSKKSTLYLLEPCHEIYLKLCNNIGLNNDCYASYMPFELAASDISGSCQFNVNDSNSGGSSLSANSLQSSSSQVVQAICLDEFVRQEGLSRIDFLKVDVEGFEPAVFEGFRESIFLFLPSLYVEITPSWHHANGANSGEFLDMLSSYGYSLYVDKGRYLTRFKSIEDIVERQFNVLAIHSSRAETVIPRLRVDAY